MSLADDVESMYKHTKDVYDAIEILGGALPNNKNLENLSDAFDSLPIQSPLPPAPDLSDPLTAAQLADLQAIVAAGKASDYYNLGDTIKVAYGAYTMPFEIVGFEDVEVEGGETVHAINLLAKYTDENGTQWGASGSTKYSASTLRSYIVNTYQGKLNADFVACLANTKTQTYSRDGSTDVVYDKLFAPSMEQLSVTDTNYNNASQAAVEGPAFTAYRGSNKTKRIRRAIWDTAAAQLYWTRSLYSGNSSVFGLVGTSGDPIGNYYNQSYVMVAACNFIGASTPAPASYTVTFQADGATNVPAPQTVAGGGVVSEPEPPVKSGYQFNYWELNGQQYDFSTPVTQDITLVANFTAIYTVTFDASGGTPAPAPQQVLSGQTATQPANPSKTGYTFNDWTLNGTAYNFSTPVTSDITLVASYVQAYDPANPTLSGLKAAINAGDYTSFPVGTEIPDTWNGENNPLIVAHYTTLTLEDGTKKPGAYLFRKYRYNSMLYGSRLYNTSGYYNWLNVNAFDVCSEELKALIKPIKIKSMTVYNNNTSYTVSDIVVKQFLMSATELGVAGNTTPTEGEHWDYFNSASRRVRTAQSGTAVEYWTRTLLTTGTNIVTIKTDGDYTWRGQSATYFTVPAVGICAD